MAISTTLCYLSLGGRLSMSIFLLAAVVAPRKFQFNLMFTICMWDVCDCECSARSVYRRHSNRIALALNIRWNVNRRRVYSRSWLTWNVYHLQFTTTKKPKTSKSAEPAQILARDANNPFGIDEPCEYKRIRVRQLLPLSNREIIFRVRWVEMKG